MNRDKIIQLFAMATYERIGEQKNIDQEYEEFGINGICKTAMNLAERYILKTKGLLWKKEVHIFQDIERIIDEYDNYTNKRTTVSRFGRRDNRWTEQHQDYIRRKDGLPRPSPENRGKSEGGDLIRQDGDLQRIFGESLEQTPPHSKNIE